MRHYLQENEFKLLVKKIVLFFIGLLTCSLLLQTAMDSGIEKSALCKEWDDIFKSKINADLLIQGNSRACFHISPEVLDSSLHLNSYNLGMDGYNFLMQYYRFNLYQIYNKKPKYIIQTVDATVLDRRKTLYAMEQFLPYLNVPIIKEATSYYDCFEPIDFIVPSAKYRHSRIAPFLAIKGFLQLSTYHYKGFETRDWKWDNTFDKYKNKNLAGVHANIDTLTKNLFNDYLIMCKNNGIKVVLVWTPEYIEAQRLFTNREEVISIFKEYSKKYGFDFIDYSNSYISYDKKYFYNSQHLNSRGVDEFNKLLVLDIKSKLQL